MERQATERIEAVLKEEGFAQIEKHTSRHSLTLSASKGKVRVVVHFTDQQEVPRGAEANVNRPEASQIKVKATLPPLGAAGATGSAGISGRGGAENVP